MNRYFNITGACDARFHYMVDLQPRLMAIKKLVDSGAYFIINRARQYGKTTTLAALRRYLNDAYEIISLDFQLFSHGDFCNENAFVSAFCSELLEQIVDKASVPETTVKELSDLSHQENASLRVLFQCMSRWCALSKKPLILMIDEVDSATNNQIFLDFLAQLRGYYIHRMERATFQSVILAGVYDIKNMKRKIREDEDHKLNSPWNIATDFTVDMSLDVNGIADMLSDYEYDHKTGMDIVQIAQLIYDYTSGYPFLVSKICKILDEQLADSEQFTKSGAWTKSGFLEAVKILLSEKNTLFESLTGKLNDYPELQQMIYTLLFCGKSIAYNPDDEAVDMASMFGFVKNENGNVVIANRLFETRLYNYFLTSGDSQKSVIYNAALQDKNQFIEDGHLNMERVLEKFVQHFDDLFGDQTETFREEEGRRYFLLYLRPIINGTGNYYIESRTRNMRKTDVIVDYKGEQFVVELKIWRGNQYNMRGENQLSDYLDYYHLKKGYMLSYCFNQKKEIGVKHIHIGDRMLVEAVV